MAANLEKHMKLTCIAPKFPLARRPPGVPLSLIRPLDAALAGNGASRRSYTMVQIPHLKAAEKVARQTESVGFIEPVVLSAL